MRVQFESTVLGTLIVLRARNLWLMALFSLNALASSVFFPPLDMNLVLSYSLQALIQKLFPRELRSVAKKDQGNKAFAKGQYQESIDFYTEALALCKSFSLIEVAWPT